MQILNKIKNTTRNVLSKLDDIFFIDKVPVQQNYQNYQNSYDNYVGDIFQDIFDGGKFPGSLGPVDGYEFVDYWTLRARSSKLFRENPYCIGVKKRLLRNEINTGLRLESNPKSKTLGITEDKASDWGDMREDDWDTWSENPKLCDWKKLKTLTELAKDCRSTALISGDCLVVLRINSKTGLPAVDLVDGVHVQSPIRDEKNKNKKIVHGVEFGSQERHTAFWIKEKSGKFKRIAAYGEKSGRRIAWLVYGTQARLDEVRGEPILSSMLYMLKELDRYRDSESRAATINSMLPMFIKKDSSSIGTKPASTGAVRNNVTAVQQTDGSTKNLNVSSWLPGTVYQGLAKGEEPVSFATNRPNVNYGKFEETIINVFAWTLEIPPEILRLLFQNSFSAARQANNEFDVYLKDRFKQFGIEFYQPVYEEWILQQALIGDIEAQSLLDAWRNPKKWREYGAWINADWTGLSRPSVDYLKDVKAGAEARKNGFTTQDMQCRKLSGLPFKTVVKKIKRENELAKKLGVSFTSEEDQNGIPISGGAETESEPTNQPQNIVNKRINKLENKITELQEKFDDMEEAVNG